MFVNQVRNNSNNIHFKSKIIRSAEGGSNMLGYDPSKLVRATSLKVNIDPKVSGQEVVSFVNDYNMIGFDPSDLIGNSSKQQKDLSRTMSGISLKK